MKQLSVEAAYQWAQRIATREWRLLLPVAFAFFALPGLVLDVAMPRATQTLMPGTPPGTPGQGVAMAALTVVAAIYCLGALAITALALVPGISVGEAIGRAVRRLPALIGALLLVSAALLLATLVLALLLGARLGAPTLQNLLVVLVVVGGAALWIRLAMLVPSLVERVLPPPAALRRSWLLTAGGFWRLLGGLGLYFVGGTILLMAFTSAIGVVIALAARALDVAPLGVTLLAVLSRLLGAVVSTGFQLLIAGLYRQLDA